MNNRENKNRNKTGVNSAFQ